MVTSVPKYSPAGNGSSGYVASRWVGEQIIERAYSEFGIPTSVHRFTMAGPSQVLSAGVREEFVHLAEKMQLVPETAGWKDGFSVIPEGQAATPLCETLSPAGQGWAAEEKVTSRFLHHECWIGIDVQALKYYVEERIGNESYEMMLFLKWVGRLKHVDLDTFSRRKISPWGVWRRERLAFRIDS